MLVISSFEIYAVNNCLCSEYKNTRLDILSYGTTVLKHATHRRVRPSLATCEWKC